VLCVRSTPEAEAENQQVEEVSVVVKTFQGEEDCGSCSRKRTSERMSISTDGQNLLDGLSHLSW